MSRSGREGIGRSGVFDAGDMSEMQNAIDAVCAELGVRETDRARRERIAGCVMQSWAAGHRTPLRLVSAGLDGAA